MVSDPTSKHLYFHYSNQAFPRQVTSVTSDAGISILYQYDQVGQLIRVSYPDNSTVNMEYDVNELITAVKDTEGKILETHTYDSLRRGLSSSRAGGVDSLSVTYPVN